MMSNAMRPAAIQDESVKLPEPFYREKSTFGWPDLYTAEQVTAAILEDRQRQEKDAERYRWLRDKANEGGDDQPMVFSCSPTVPITWDAARYGYDLDAAVDAALAALKETQ